LVEVNNRGEKSMGGPPGRERKKMVKRERCTVK